MAGARGSHRGDVLDGDSLASNPHLSGRGKLGVLISCGAAVICGAAVTLVNFFWDVGQAV